MSAIPKLAKTTARIYPLRDYLENHPDKKGKLYANGYYAYMWQIQCSKTMHEAYESGKCYACGTCLVVAVEDGGRV
jgi:hypothetical protein